MTSAHGIPKEHWGPGPWQSEPDRLEWRAHNLACLIVRNQLGALCGYVGVPRKHPLFGRSHSTIESRVDVHGGLTFSGGCEGHICHADPEPVHWFGFDCAHYRDFCPGTAATLALAGAPFTTALARPFGDTYRDLDFVKRETEELARQIAGIGGGKTRRLLARAESRSRRDRRKQLVRAAGDATRWIRPANHLAFGVRLEASMGIRIPRSLRSGIQAKKSYSMFAPEEAE